MMPLVAGTLVGSKLAGKLARPVDQNPSEEERAKIPLWEKKSFLRTWFPWSVCGPRCQSLAPEGGDPKKDTVRFVGFRIPALGEWPAILIGICLSLSMAATFGRSQPGLLTRLSSDCLLVPLNALATSDLSELWLPAAFG